MHGKMFNTKIFLGGVLMSIFKGLTSGILRNIVEVLLLLVIWSISIATIQMFFNVSVDAAVGIVLTIGLLLAIIFVIPKLFKAFKCMEEKWAQVFFISIFCILGPACWFLIGISLIVSNL